MRSQRYVYLCNYIYTYLLNFIGGAHVPPNACRGQRTTCRSHLSPSTMDEYQELTQGVSLGGKCLYLLSHLSGSHLDIKYPLRPSFWGGKSLLHIQQIDGIIFI